MRPDRWAGLAPRRWQSEAFEEVIRSLRGGIRRPLVHACTGSGKSRLLGALASACKGSVLITTPTQALVEQLADTIKEHVGSSRVGRCFQHAWEIDRPVVVACIPSLPAVLDKRPSWACWLADEAHRLEGERTRQVRDRLTIKVSVGFTATPFRGDTRGLVTWDKLIYSYTSHDAVKEGVLVPWRVVRSSQVADVDELTRKWVKRAEGPGIVSAISVKDAEQCAKKLGALPIHGYLPRSVQAERIRALRNGKVPCLVHVQLLTEGIDLPWLRWLVLRRPVRSPVRLVQEVGRVLRAAPGKTRAVLYDPHDCLGDVGLVHGAALEDAQARETKAGDDWSIPELPGLEDLAELPKSRAISMLSAWVTDALGALRGAGVAPPPSKDVNPHGPWRRKKATEKQWWAAQKAVKASRYLPTDTHRAVVDLLLGEDKLRAGTAFDLLAILFAVRRHRGTRGVELPPICALEPA